MNRRMDTPYYKNKNSAERDHAHLATFTIALTFIVGAMCGASIALGLM